MSTPAGRALVMGLGSFGGGSGAARYLARRGHRVVATDLRTAEGLAETLAELADLDLELVLGEHRPEDFERAELVVVNPAVAPDHPLVARARAAGARITSEIELALEALEARLVCVSGTQGKSSTVHLCAELLAACGLRVHRGGNLGGSLLTRLDAIGREDVCVLELSSYQLQALGDPAALGRRVEAVCLTNVLADHLERHGSLDAYAAAKRRLLDLVPAGGTALVPAADARVRAWPTRGRRVLFAGDDDPAAELRIVDGRFLHGDAVLGTVADLAVPGRFQATNALCALGLAHAMGAPAGALARALPELRALPHRVEPLGRYRGRLVIDNAVSTTPDSTVAALRELAPGGCVLLGGRRKALPLDELADAVRSAEALAVVFGEAADELALALEAGGVVTARAATVEEACEVAFERTPPGGSILFSPACSSFDAYRNFRERAEAFRAALPTRDE